MWSAGSQVLRGGSKKQVDPSGDWTTSVYSVEPRVMVKEDKKQGSEAENEVPGTRKKIAVDGLPL